MFVPRRLFNYIYINLYKYTYMYIVYTSIIYNARISIYSYIYAYVCISPTTPRKQKKQKTEHGFLTSPTAHDL